MKEIERRLFANRLIDENGCWLWTKSCRANGYGQTSYRMGGKLRNVPVHRLAAHLWLNFDLDSLCVLHRCDVKRCFNPDHLFIGTEADNTADMVAKGRHRYSLPMQKPPDVVEEALRLVAAGSSQRAAARQLGVSHTAVQDWVRQSR